MFAATNVQTLVIPGIGHWLAEQAPRGAAGRADSVPDRVTGRTGQGRGPQHIAAAYAPIPGVDAVAAGGAARSENTRRITSQPTGGKSGRL